MPHLCKCGGRLEHHLEDVTAFQKKCNRCGNIYHQRKRQAKKRD